MEKREYLYKILVIGDHAVGKSSIVKRYVHNFFTERYKATIGVDFAMKVLNLGENTVIRLQLWDIAGQERLRQLNRVFYNEASGCITVYDVTRSDTLEAVAKWKEEIDLKVQLPNGEPIPCVLFANKCDLLENDDNDLTSKGPAITKEVMEDYSKKYGFIDWFFTSARDNVNLEDGTRRLVEKILQNNENHGVNSANKRDGNSVKLNQASGKPPKKGCCK